MLSIVISETNSSPNLIFADANISMLKFGNTNIDVCVFQNRENPSIFLKKCLLFILKILNTYNTKYKHIIVVFDYSIVVKKIPNLILLCEYSKINFCEYT